MRLGPIISREGDRGSMFVVSRAGCAYAGDAFEDVVALGPDIREAKHKDTARRRSRCIGISVIRSLRRGTH